MLMALRACAFVACPLLAVFAFASELAVAQVAPQPKVHKSADGTILARAVRCDVDEFRPQAVALRDALRDIGATKFGDDAGKSASIVMKRAELPHNEQYRIQADAKSIVVTARSPRAMARATATLLQLARVEAGHASWPLGTIEDRPDLDFRCFMVDMARNPHPPEVLRRIVDACWFYKVSYLQLHLTDDQLFSWPSRAFPDLFDERSGWSWDAFVELERYSQARGVTIIPEIDVPGHSTILRKRYPEVFGKTPTELATLPEATHGVQTLLDEFLSVFRATPFVHVGGDEAYGVPGDAQRDFLNRLHRYLKKKGRRAIAWEGPALGKGEHKVDTDVLHMNWRTINFPAQEMIDAGYEVVNTAWDPLYIVDHYPRTMFTAVPVERCYDWDLRRFAHVNHGIRTFAEPHLTRSKKRIVGFCMPWWEGRQENVLGLCVPRLAAVASAAWNRAGENSYFRFAKRQEQLLPRLEKLMGQELPRLPVADPDAEGFDAANLAYGKKVTPSRGASQPVYGPQRLTNGLKDRFDHFLGYPTQPDALEIVVDLGAPQSVSRVVVHETSVGQSHEIYELLVSADGRSFDQVGAAKKGSRGKQTFVTHRFDARPVRFVKIATHGCHGLTFPSFSRLCEIEVYAQ